MLITKYKNDKKRGVMFALADCNNFYASCERVFQPSLRNKPVIVLSNNDGCVIARSNEAKALGIKMATPFFKIKSFCKQEDVAVFSSNYALYGDMSQRVMTALESFCPDIEFYSIDEAFLRFDRLNHDCLLSTCEEMRETVHRWTGIPISVGIGATKTLAKLASFIAKKHLKKSVFYLSSSRYDDHLLARVPVGELWGIGRRLEQRLNQQGITTVLQLKQAPTAQLRSDYGVTVERTCRELQGSLCLELESAQAKKNIVSSRSFGTKQTDYEPIAQALAGYAARACEKMRSQNSATQSISVWITTNIFNDDKRYQNSIVAQLPTATNNTSVITSYAKRCLKKIYKPGFEYQKTGIMLINLTDASTGQQDLFQDHRQQQKSDELMKVMDAVNQRMGKQTIVTAAQGFNQSTAMRNDYCSPHYTTCWRDLPKVN